MTIPHISIIIPVYNSSATLNNCIDSVLSQDFGDFELLLIDDGSKDDSLQKCKEYAGKDSRIRVFQKENGGVSSARNVGLDNARGEWITFVDSDDYIEPLFLEALNHDIVCMYMKTMKTFRNSNNLYTVNGYVKQECLYGERLAAYIKKNVSGYIFRGPCGKFYKRSLIADSRFKEDMKVAEDACFVMNYLSKIDRLMQMPQGAYVARLGNIPANVKYSMTVSYAANSLKHLYTAYNKVNEKFQIGAYGFFPFIGSFKLMSQSDWKEKKSKWYKNKEIWFFYKYVWSSLPLKLKMRLVAARILRM